MATQFGFTSFTLAEFKNWINSISVQRAILRVQEHHTWRPNYSHFNGSNHFQLQRNMQNHHVNNNGWSDIGQHFTIFPDGIIMTGRSLNSSPACIFNGNFGAICIENLGDFDTDKDSMSAAQRNSIIGATAALLNRFDLGNPDKNNVHYHHWWTSEGHLTHGIDPVKSCPGSAFFGGNTVASFESNFAPLVLAAMSDSATPGQVAVDKWVAVETEQLNIRTGPISTASLANDMGPLPLGTIVRVFSEENNWYKISNSKDRWIYGRLTHDVVPKTVNTNDSKVRFGPGTEFAEINAFNIGHKIFVHEQSGSWSRIGVDSWMHSSLLS